MINNNGYVKVVLILIVCILSFSLVNNNVSAVSILNESDLFNGSELIINGLLHLDNDNQGYFSFGVGGDNNFIYAANSGSIVVYSININGSLTITDDYETYYPRGVWSDGNFVYVAEGNTGIDVYSVNSNGELLHIDDDYRGSSSSQNVWGDGNFIYVANNARGIDVYSVSETGMLTHLDNDDQGGTAYDVWGDGNFIYVANLARGIEVYSVDGSGILTHIDNDYQGGYGYNVWGDGNFIYLASNDRGLEVYNVSINGTLTHVDNDDQGGNALGVWGDGDFIYLANNLNGLEVYTVSVNGTLTHVDNDDQGGEAYVVWGDGDFIYLANYNRGVEVYYMDSSLGGVFNITNNDINTNTTFTNYNLTITKPSDPTYSEFLNFSQANNLIGYLEDGLYTLSFVSAQYIEKEYLVQMTTQYSECLQEMFNVSETCGALDGGSVNYTVSDFNNPANMFDGNLSTYADVTSIDYTDINITYEVLSGVNVSQWNVYAFDNGTSTTVNLNVTGYDYLYLKLKAQQYVDSDSLLLQESQGFEENWTTDANIDDGYIETGYHAKPSIFYDENNILSHITGYNVRISSQISVVYIYGERWNGTTWIYSNTSNITNGLPSSGVDIFPSVFYDQNRNRHIMITASTSPYIRGYTWNGTGWDRNTSLDVTGYGSLGHQSLTTYSISDDLRMAHVSRGTYNDFSWNGTGWEFSHTFSGLGAVGTTELRHITVYKEDNDYKMLTSRYGGNANIILTWNGTGWDDGYFYTMPYSSMVGSVFYDNEGQKIIWGTYSVEEVIGQKKLPINFSNITYTATDTYDSKIYGETMNWLTEQDKIVNVTYNSSNALITFRFRNIKTLEYISDYTFSINDTDTGIVTEYNVTGTTITLPLKAGVEYITSFDKDTYYEEENTFNYTFDYLDEYTVTEDVSYVLNVNLINEETLAPFNFTGTDTVKFLVECNDRTLYFDFTNSTEEVPITCTYERIKVAITYPLDNVTLLSTGADYYRNLLVDYTEASEVDIYLIDMLNTPYIYTNFIIDDLLSEYYNPSIWIKKLTENETVVIHSDVVDIENKIAAFLIRNHEYIIEVRSDNRPVQVIGRYSADFGAEKVISLYEVSLQTDSEDFFRDVYYSANIINNTVDDNQSVVFSYHDESGNTTSVQFSVYADSINGALIYQSTNYTGINSIPSLVFDLGAYSNRTIVTKIDAIHSEYGRKELTSLANVNFAIREVPNIVAEMAGEHFLSWFLLLILSAVAIYVNLNGGWGPILIVGLALLFSLFEWFEVSIPIIALLLLMGVMDIFRGKK